MSDEGGNNEQSVLSGDGARKIEVSVVICAYTMRRWDDICEAVESLESGRLTPDEIILVIDHNLELLDRARHRFPGCKVIENRHAQGLSGARNSGLEAAGGRYIAFLDDDAVAGETWLSSLVESCRKPGVYGAVSRVLPKWTSRRPHWFPDEFLWTIGCTYRGMPAESESVRNLFGGAMCVRRELFDSVGGFNTRLGRTASGLPISCEETELCLRARASMPDIDFRFEPDAMCWHKVPGDRLTWQYLMLRCYAEGISKQRLVQLNPGRMSLARERSYVLRTLLSGIFKNLGDVVRKGDLHGAMRAAAICIGFTATVTGYLVSRIGTLVQTQPVRLSKDASSDAPGPIANVSEGPAK